MNRRDRMFMRKHGALKSDAPRELTFIKYAGPTTSVNMAESAPATPPLADLSKLNKPALIALAVERGLDPAGMNKAALLAALQPASEEKKSEEKNEDAQPAE